MPEVRNHIYFRNQRVTFQKKVVKNDVYENQVGIWEDFFSCFAYADTNSAVETDGAIPYERRDIVFEVRYCPEIMQINSVDYRLIFKSKTYDIISIDPMNYQYDTVKIHTQLDPALHQKG